MAARWKCSSASFRRPAARSAMAKFIWVATSSGLTLAEGAINATASAALPCCRRSTPSM